MSNPNIDEARKVILDRGKEVVCTIYKCLADTQMDSIASKGAADNAINSQSEFTKPAYEYLMRSCFAGIWDRDGLEKRYRSLTVISYVPFGCLISRFRLCKSQDFSFYRQNLATEGSRQDGIGQRAERRGDQGMLIACYGILRISYRS